MLSVVYTVCVPLCQTVFGICCIYLSRGLAPLHTHSCKVDCRSTIAIVLSICRAKFTSAPCACCHKICMLHLRACQASDSETCHGGSARGLLHALSLEVSHVSLFSHLCQFCGPAYLYMADASVSFFSLSRRWRAASSRTPSASLSLVKSSLRSLRPSLLGTLGMHQWVAPCLARSCRRCISQISHS